jgi:hypothetical protein
MCVATSVIPGAPSFPFAPARKSLLYAIFFVWSSRAMQSCSGGCRIDEHGDLGLASALATYADCKSPALDIDPCGVVRRI